MANLQVECSDPKIQWFIPNKKVNLSTGAFDCNDGLNSLADLHLKQEGLSQIDYVNFKNTITLYTDNINNDIQTFTTAYTNGLPSGYYQNNYLAGNLNEYVLLVKFLLQITKLSDNDDNKITKTYLQAYYTNDMKLKIRFKKVLFAQLSLVISDSYHYLFGNDKNITIDINNQNVLGIRNISNNPVKITIKSR